LTRAYAVRLAPDGVTVNAVAPALVDTEMGKPLIEAGIAARAHRPRRHWRRDRASRHAADW
jgi:NAD(P)-dependent dehydrogenase (short-subunit alcohol dehydrogenase family)